MAKLSRTKGKAYEQDVARRLRTALPHWKVKRCWQAAGDKVPDVLAGYLAIECKHRRKMDPRDHMKQAVENAGRGQVPVCFLKWHGGYEMCCLLPDDLVELLKELEEYREVAA